MRTAVAPRKTHCHPLRASVNIDVALETQSQFSKVVVVFTSFFKLRQYCISHFLCCSTTSVHQAVNSEAEWSCCRGEDLSPPLWFGLNMHDRRRCLVATAMLRQAAPRTCTARLFQVASEKKTFIQVNASSPDRNIKWIIVPTAIQRSQSDASVLEVGGWSSSVISHYLSKHWLMFVGSDFVKFVRIKFPRAASQHDV